MTINHEIKLIFIHIPKNAGTSIVDELERIGGYRFPMAGHHNISEYKKQYEKYWSEYTKFAVVRDPIDRFISGYKFATMKESYWHSSSNKGGKLKHSHYDIAYKKDINEYVSFLYEYPKNFDIHLLPQSLFIGDNNFKVTDIDYFARYENLKKDLKKIKINNIPKINISYIDNQNRIKLTKKSKKKIYEMYDIDYKNFNYSKIPYTYL